MKSIVPGSLLRLCDPVCEGLLHPVCLFPQVLAGVGQSAANDTPQPVIDTFGDKVIHCTVSEEHDLTNLMLASLSCSARRMLLSENVCQSPGKLSATLYRALPDLRWMLPRVFFRLTLRESEQLNSIIYSLYNLQLQ